MQTRCVLRNDQGHELEVAVVADGMQLELRPKGYGEFDAQDGHGSPVFLDLDLDGRLRVVVSPDINSGNKQIIDLEGAKESARTP